jgi:hypothetical protein
MGHTDELPAHLHRAIANGVTKTELAAANRAEARAGPRQGELPSLLRGRAPVSAGQFPRLVFGDEFCRASAFIYANRAGVVCEPAKCDFLLKGTL